MQISKNRKLQVLAIACAAAGWVAGAQHASAAIAFSYGYAQQTLSGLTVSGTGISNTQVTGFSTSASAAINGVGVATNAPLDTLEAYQGASPAAPQNDFTKYALVGGGSQAGNFTRGDALLGNTSLLFSTGASASAVAESVFSTATGPADLETGNSSWQIAGSFNSSGSSISIGYGYANDLISQANGVVAGPAQAGFDLTFALHDQHGHTFSSNPSASNSSNSAPPNGPEIITSGTSSVTIPLSGLTPGDTYTITITGHASSSVGNTVPEPLALGTFTVLGGMALTARRRKAR